MGATVQIGDLNLNVVFKRLEELIKNPKTARVHSKKKIHKMVKCIKSSKILTPLAIDGENVIRSGNCRYEAAKILGLQSVPTVCLDHLTPEELTAYEIADNKLVEEATWDMEILKIKMEGLIDANFDIELTAFEIPQIDMIVIDPPKEKIKKADKFDDPLSEEEIIPRIVNPGDVYQLGDHRLICGDSTKPETFSKLLQGQMASLVFTDPPYNVKINGNVCEKGKHDEFIMGSGEMGNDEFTSFLNQVFTNIVANTCDGSISYICMDWRHCQNVLDASKSLYSELKNICCWDKGTGAMGSLYRSQHEFIFVYKNGTASHINNVELGKHGRYRTNVWAYPGVRASNPNSLQDLKFHPTVKPVSMVMDAILDCSKPNDIVLDAFGGSGTTLLAAERTKRRAYVIELEPKFCDVIIYRYMKLFKKGDVKLISSKKAEV